MAVRVRVNSMVPTTSDVAYVELDADSVDDLTGLTTVDGWTIRAGSLCLVIGTGHVYALDGDGNWKNQTEPDAANRAEQVTDTRAVKHAEPAADALVDEPDAPEEKPEETAEEPAEEEPKKRKRRSTDGDAGDNQGV